MKIKKNEQITCIAGSLFVIADVLMWACPLKPLKYVESRWLSWESFLLII